MQSIFMEFLRKLKWCKFLKNFFEFNFYCCCCCDIFFGNQSLSVYREVWNTLKWIICCGFVWLYLHMFVDFAEGDENFINHKLSSIMAAAFIKNYSTTNEHKTQSRVESSWFRALDLFEENASSIFIYFYICLSFCIVLL